MEWAKHNILNLAGRCFGRVFEKKGFNIFFSKQKKKIWQVQARCHGVFWSSFFILFLKLYSFLQCQSFQNKHHMVFRFRISLLVLYHWLGLVEKLLVNSFSSSLTLLFNVNNTSIVHFFCLKFSLFEEYTQGLPTDHQTLCRISVTKLRSRFQISRTPRLFVCSLYILIKLYKEQASFRRHFTPPYRPPICKPF